MAGETPKEAFDRGHTAGEIAEQLGAHEARLAKINGSIERFAKALEGLKDGHAQSSEVLRLAIQRLEDSSKAGDAKAIALAEALEKDAETRRNTDDSRWTPTGRALGVLMAVIAAVGLMVTVYAITRT